MAIDINATWSGCLFRFSDYLLKLFKLLKLNSREFEKFVIIQRSILEATLYDTLDLSPLELTQHSLHIVGLHTAP